MIARLLSLFFPAPVPSHFTPLCREIAPSPHWESGGVWRYVAEAEDFEAVSR